MVQPIQTPYYQKLSLTLISLAILTVLIYYGQGIILPFLFAVLLSMLLLPVTNFLARKKFPKVLSILLPLILSFILIEGINEQGPKLVGITFLSVTEMIAYVVLLPIYTFLMLFYRTTIKTFFIKVFKNGSEDRIREVLS